MNYQTIYDDIIKKAKIENRKKSKDLYFEKHHIIPKCISGDDSLENLILLTGKEHFICHHLLTKIYPDSNSLHTAFWLMCIYTSSNQKRIKPTSTTFETAKHNFATIQSKRISEYNTLNPKKGELNGMYGIHRYGDENPFYGKTHSDEAKQKIGLKNSQTIWSIESKQKLKDKWKIKPIAICPHCGLTGKGPNMTRYHFDNCKLKVQE